jgi:hypothetical protein
MIGPQICFEFSSRFQYFHILVFETTGNCAALVSFFAKPTEETYLPLAREGRRKIT